MGKEYFRCKICGDIHYGSAGPEICPTCKQENAYMAIKKDDAKTLMGM
jgi:rubrerythrin